MSDNHRRNRQPHDQPPPHRDQPDRLLDDLNATMPQARPAFQQALEQQLVAVLHEQQENSTKRRDLPMQSTTHEPIYRARKRTKIPASADPGWQPWPC